MNEQTRVPQSEAAQLLCELVSALDGAFISSWQSTAAWQKQLDAARAYIAAKCLNQPIVQ